MYSSATDHATCTLKLPLILLEKCILAPYSDCFLGVIRHSHQ